MLRGKTPLAPLGVRDVVQIEVGVVLGGVGVGVKVGGIKKEKRSGNSASNILYSLHKFE